MHTGEREKKTRTKQDPNRSQGQTISDLKMTKTTTKKQGKKPNRINIIVCTTTEIKRQNHVYEWPNGHHAKVQD